MGPDVLLPVHRPLIVQLVSGGESTFCIRRNSNKSFDLRTYGELVNVNASTNLVRSSQRGIPESDIGVISTYQDQVLCLKGILPEGIESSTVDRYQGKEKEVMIMSCVRSELDAVFVSMTMNYRRNPTSFWTRIERHFNNEN